MRSLSHVRVIQRKENSETNLVKDCYTEQYFVEKTVRCGSLSNNEKQLALQEGEIMSSMKNKNVVEYESHKRTEDTSQIVMEYCSEGDLAQQLKCVVASGSVLSDRTVLSVFIQLCEGLHYIHTHGIIHRDIKPDNIFITHGVMKLGDFGLACAVPAVRKPSESCPVGTPYYIAPELWANKAHSTKSDIWALGCVLYQLCTLKRPFQASNLGALVFQVAFTTPTGLMDTSRPQEDGMCKVLEGRCPELKVLLAQLLHKEPEHRPEAGDVLKLPFICNHIEDRIIDDAGVVQAWCKRSKREDEYEDGGVSSASSSPSSAPLVVLPQPQRPVALVRRNRYAFVHGRSHRLSRRRASLREGVSSSTSVSSLVGGGGLRRAGSTPPAVGRRGVGVAAVRGSEAS